MKRTEINTWHRVALSMDKAINISLKVNGDVTAGMERLWFLPLCDRAAPSAESAVNLVKELSLR